ncbi:hypothetical protein C0J52_28205, partial [Blattella germanica]
DAQRSCGEYQLKTLWLGASLVTKVPLFFVDETVSNWSVRQKLQTCLKNHFSSPDSRDQQLVDGYIKLLGKRSCGEYQLKTLWFKCQVGCIARHSGAVGFVDETVSNWSVRQKLQTCLKNHFSSPDSRDQQLVDGYIKLLDCDSSELVSHSFSYLYCFAEPVKLLYLLFTLSGFLIQYGFC